MNLSDKELDRLSREAAEKYEVEKDFGAWNKLEQLLDKEMGRSSPAPRFIRPGNPFIYFPALAILIGSILLITKPSKNTQNSTLQNNSSVNKKAGKNGETKTTADAAKNNFINKESSANINDVAKNDSINKNEPVNKEENISANKKINSISSSNKNEERNNIINNSSSLKNNKTADSHFSENNNKSKFVSKHNVTNGDGYAQLNNHLYTDKNADTKNHSAKNKNHFNNNINKDGKNINDENEYSPVNNNNKNLLKTDNVADENLKLIGIGNIESLHQKKYIVHDSVLHHLPMQETGLINNKINNHGKKLYTNRSLQIGVLFSPDFSEVKEDYVNKVGSNIGFTVSYQLANRFSINSGLIFTRKFYTINGHDFHAPPGYWTNMVHLDFVKGNCNMLEIPLNVRYDFNRNNNTTFFVGGGLSSYLMKKENYSYFFHNNGFRPLLYYQRSTYATDHNYWLSVLNLSIGFETKISNSFSFEAEPYMKLPLTGIGFGKVNLSSYGINLSLKFSPLLSRSRH